MRELSSGHGSGTVVGEDGADFRGRSLPAFEVWANERWWLRTDCGGGEGAKKLLAADERRWTADRKRFIWSELYTTFLAAIFFASRPGDFGEVAICLNFAATTTIAQTSNAVNFDREVRPILSNNCFPLPWTRREFPHRRLPSRPPR